MAKAREDFAILPVQVPGEDVREAFGLAVYNSKGELTQFEGIFENGQSLYYRPGLQTWNERRSDHAFTVVDKILQKVGEKKVLTNKIPKKFHWALGL